MEFRHEFKHILNYSDYFLLRGRLRHIMPPDPHAGPDGCYQIRSLYFDDWRDHALREKLYGISRREKFRLRLYNYDLSLIRLEKKVRRANLSHKESVLLTESQVRSILSGDWDWMQKSGTPLLVECYSKLTGQLLRPKTVVDYTREPFVFAPGNVRVTLDHHIRTGLLSTDFLNPNLVTVDAGGPVCILEVKYDRFLPDLIRDAIQMDYRQTSAFSKYADCRLYG